MRSRLPGPQLPAQTGSFPVNAASAPRREGRGLFLLHAHPLDPVASSYRIRDAWRKLPATPHMRSKPAAARTVTNSSATFLPLLEPSRILDMSAVNRILLADNLCMCRPSSYREPFCHADADFSTDHAPGHVATQAVMHLQSSPDLM